MKGSFGLIGLLLALAIVGLLVKQQLTLTRQIAPAPQLSPMQSPQGAASAATVREQAAQTQQQLKQAVEATLSKPRDEPAEK